MSDIMDLDNLKLKIINFYKRNECLWMPRHPNYYNRNIRRQLMEEFASEINFSGN